MKILECSSRSDRRFSALTARVELCGETGTIENHYQLAKRWYGEDPPATWRAAKGRKPDYFVVCGRELPIEELSNFYFALWQKYLDNHSELVEYARTFDKFTDVFSKTGSNSQADCISRYMKGERTKFEIN